MIQFAEGLWVGDSAFHRNAPAVGIGGVLNVACDLAPKIFYPALEYMQVGLVDGPGNEVGAYCSAILAVVTLRKRHEVVAVYDHKGSRATVVCLMYLTLVGGKRRNRPTEWSHWLGWDEQVAAVSERTCTPLPKVHEAHKEAYAEIPFGLLEVFL